jgi:hypothetical protein
MSEIDQFLTAKPASKLPKFTDEQIREFLRQECKEFSDALTSDPEVARQEIQKRIKKLVLTPKVTAEGPVLEVSGDVALLRTGDVLVESPIHGLLSNTSPSLPPLQGLSSAPPVMWSPKKQREPRSWCICRMSESAHSVCAGARTNKASPKAAGRSP